MKKLMVGFVIMLALLCTGCRAEVEWETVSDDAALASAPLEEPYIITFGVPDDATMDPLSERNCSLYTHESGDYEILSDVISAYTLDAALRELTGYGEGEIDYIETTRFGLPSYQFAWAASSDEGMYVSRATMVQDGGYYYALVFSVREGLGTAYDDCAEAVFSSFGIYGDESF